MNLKLSHISTIMVATLTILLSGCTQKELCYPDSGFSGLSVEFLWDRARGAETEGMTLYFFPESREGRIWRFDIEGRDGGPVEIAPGRYKMVAVNNDLPGVFMSVPETYGELSANARPAGGADGTVAPTGMLYGVSVPEVDVMLCGVSYTLADGSRHSCPRGILSCYPDSIATVYNIKIRDIDGLDRVASASARIGGIAPEVFVSTGIRPPSRASIRMQLERAAEVLQGITTGLGTPSGHPEISFDLMLTLTGGGKYVKSFDITEQVVNSPSPHNVYIMIEGITVPEDNPPGPSDPDVGIEVGVDGWQEIVTDYTTGL